MKKETLKWIVQIIASIATALLSIMPGRASCDGRKELFLVLAKTYGGCCRVSGSVYPFINDIGGTLVG